MLNWDSGFIWLIELAAPVKYFSSVRCYLGTEGKGSWQLSVPPGPKIDMTYGVIWMMELFRYPLLCVFSNH